MLKTFEDILKKKTDYYGDTPAAHQFARQEWSKYNYEQQFTKLNTMAKASTDITVKINDKDAQRKLLKLQAAAQKFVDVVEQCQDLKVTISVVEKKPTLWNRITSLLR